MPYYSSSRKRLYFLDGDTDIRFLQADGTTGLVKRLQVGHLQHAAFAVSPDDQSIAVAVIDYSVSPHHLRVYTEDLADGAHHRDLFTSSARFEWPIGWVGTNLLMAVGPTGAQDGPGDPYRADFGYRLLDQDGNFVRAFCAPAPGGDFGSAGGPLDPDGAICKSGTGFVLQRWTGGDVQLPGRACGTWATVQYSPDRRSMLCVDQPVNAPTVVFHVVTAAGREVRSRPEPADQYAGATFAWTGDGHVVIGDEILDIQSGALGKLPPESSIVGRLPGELY